MKNLFKLLIAVAAITCVASIYAVPTLTLTDSSSAATVTVTDGSGGDSCAAAGCVTFNGTLGAWNITANATGLTKPASGSPSDPNMDLSYQLASGTGTAASTMTIDWSDSGFSGTVNLTDLLGGTLKAGMTVTDNVYVNGSLIMTLGPFTSSSYSGSTNDIVTLTSTDVLTLEMVVSKPAGQFNASGDKNVLRVPDGGSAVALLGIALAGIEAGRRLLRARKA